MGILAIFVDGGYLEQQSRRYDTRVDVSKLVSQIRATVGGKTHESLDLLRTYYYDCLPYQSNPTTAEEDRRFSQKRRFFDRLRYLERFEVREGRLALRGYDSSGKPFFQQKRTDLLLGLDFALLSGKSRITHAAVVAGDSDFLPALEVAKQEGVSVWLFHGTGGSFAQELWLAADERCEMTREFMDSVKR